MVYAKGFAFENQQCKHAKNAKCDDFLHDFELPNVKRTAVADVAVFIRWYEQTILEKRHAPAKENNPKKPKVAKKRDFGKFQVRIPRNRHQNI